MSGEGVCFLHSPPGYGPRPVDTGWYAGFGQLESGVSGQIPYAEDGSRFAGATYDPSGIYRMRAVLGWLEASGVTVADIRAHVVGLQDRLLTTAVHPGQLIPGSPHDSGNFLTFRSEGAGDFYRALHERGVVTDYRGDRLRIGLGVYHDEGDVDRLTEVLAGLRTIRD
jgi:selenocysteine lyase/cysteine desulfurase